MPSRRMILFEERPPCLAPPDPPGREKRAIVVDGDLAGTAKLVLLLDPRTGAVQARPARVGDGLVPLEHDRVVALQVALHVLGRRRTEHRPPGVAVEAIVSRTAWELAEEKLNHLEVVAVVVGA